MVRILVAALAFALLASSGTSQLLHHAVATSNAQAQRAFDRGLLEYYAYNPEAAEHDFYTAADLDKHLAMAYWGIALSNASNLNVPATDDREFQAEYAIQQAQSLEKYASVEDRALIEAAAMRFSANPKADRSALLRHYRDAMRRVALRFPEDPDAAALFAEASLYVAAGNLANNKDTLSDADRAAYAHRMMQLIPTVQSDLAAFPNHIGLLHFYIHIANEANDETAAIDAARRLAAFTLPPEDAHLTHMPGHIFFKVGLYQEGLNVAARSVRMDHEEVDCCHPGFYSEPRSYHSHNVDFLLYALSETGRARDALAAARQEGDPVIIARQLVELHRWRDVTTIPSDNGQSDTLSFARALAFAQLGERKNAEQSLAQMPPVSGSPGFAQTVQAMKTLVRAAIAEQNGDEARAMDLLQQASVQGDRGDTMSVAEFPSLYYYSPHLVLADLAQRLGKPDIAKKALEAELAMNPRSPTVERELARLH